MSLLYLCDGCGALATYLSESWSVVTIYRWKVDEAHELKHFCLECRSNKQEAPDLQRQ